MTIKEKRLRPHSPISMLSLLCNGGIDKISKQKIRNQLYSRPNTDRDIYTDDGLVSETKHTLDVPILLRNLFKLPNKYERKIESWYPIKAVVEGLSFIISPSEVNRGVLLEDSILKEFFYLSGLPSEKMTLISCNYEIFILTRKKKGLWEGFNNLVDGVGLTGGERIGFALANKGQVYFEVIDKDPFWSNWSDFLNAVYLCTTSKEVAFLLRKHGVTYTDYETNEIILKGLYDLGLSYDSCQQVIRDLRTLNYRNIKSDPVITVNRKTITDFVDTTLESNSGSYMHVERSDSSFMGSTEDLLTELVNRFNLQNEESLRLREENRHLKEKIKSLEQQRPFSIEKEVPEAFVAPEMDISRLARYSALYQTNGPIMTYIVNILAMTGDEGLEIKELEELVYFHYSINRMDLNQIIELYPFFTMKGEKIMIDSTIHSMVVSHILDTAIPTTAERIESSIIEGNRNEYNKECTADEILEALNLDRAINENSEEVLFKKLHDYIQMLFEEKRYSVLIELEARIRDLFLLDLQHELFFRRCLLLLSAAFLLDNNKMRSEVYWDKYLATCKVCTEKDRENLILGLLLSFILEIDDSFFDNVGREAIETGNGIELELYQLVYEINNEKEASPALFRKLERALDRYRESIEKEKKKYIDLHREYLETIKISIEKEVENYGC